MFFNFFLSADQFTCFYLITIVRMYMIDGFIYNLITFIRMYMLWLFRQFTNQSAICVKAHICMLMKDIICVTANYIITFILTFTAVNVHAQTVIGTIQLQFLFCGYLHITIFIMYMFLFTANSLFFHSDCRKYQHICRAEHNNCS